MTRHTTNRRDTRVACLTLKPAAVPAVLRGGPCDDPFVAVPYGRCWRCSLACGLPVSAELGSAYDTARVCA